MKTTNSLPKYWVVQCNTSNPNWRKVIDYLKNVHGEKWGGDVDGGLYGYDGGSCFNGTNVFNNISYFQNSPVVLTIEEFVEMTEGFVLPEKWCIKRNKENDKIVTDFINNYSESKHCYLDYNPKNPYLHYTKGVSSNCKPWNNYTEITFEQFKKHVLKTEETMRTITHTQAQSIIDIACRELKYRLFELWGKDIVMKKSIGISDTYYQAMRKACTSEQNQLFDEIFGSDKPTFKIGDWVYAERRSDDDWRDDAKYIPTFQIKEFSNCGGYARPEAGKTTGIHVNGLRLATQEEIQKAKYIPEGTPCLVRDIDEESWKFAYSNGDGTFNTGISNYAWRQVKVLDMKDLPKF